MNDDLRDLILEHIDRTYICTWGDKIRLRETDKEIKLDMLISKLANTYSANPLEVEIIVLYHLVKVNRDIDNIISKWDRSDMIRLREVAPEHTRTPSSEIIEKLLKDYLKL
jgi:hypothetical protein